MKKYAYVGPILFLLIWAAITGFHLVNAFFLPSPVAVFGKLLKIFSDGGIFPDIFATLFRISVSFIVAAGIGLPAGLLLGGFEKAYRSLEFIIDFCRSLAPLAVFPLFMIVFGIGDASKIAVAAISSSVVIIFNVAYGVMHSKKSRILAAQIMGASRLQIFRSVIFWESLPQIFVGIRNAIAWIVLIIIAAEMFVGTNVGLGHRIIDFQITYDLPGMYAAIFLTGVLGYVLNAIFALAERRIVHWSGK